MKKTRMNLNEGENVSSRFFKVILKEDLQHPLQLMIPTKFAMKHGNDLSDLVRLKVPGGDTWQVKVRKKDGKVLLRNGWADFLKHYQISHGHFVVFDYQGESRFDVVILDVTACEIEYPIKPHHGRTSRPADEPPLGPKSEEVIDLEFQPRTYRSSKGKKNLPMCGPRPSKITETATGASRDGGTAKREFRSPEEELEGVKRRRRGMSGGPWNAECLRVKTQVARVAGGALSRASSYQCKRPSFFVALGRGSVYPNFMLCIPKKFSKTCNLKQGESGDIRLWIPGGDTWTVGYFNNDRCLVSRGWKEFVVGNDLRFGDVCLFELIEMTELTLRVVIFRGDGVSPPGGSSGKRRQPFGKAAARKSANEGHSPRPVDSEISEENPSFEVVICKSSAEGNFLHIPNGFSRSHLQGIRASNKATLKFAQRSWPIELVNYGSHTAVSYRMIGGWGRFTRDNDLRTKDVCVFKLVDKKLLVFEVSIRKH